jgi:hypothetical protein
MAVLLVCGVLTINFSSVIAAEKPNILVVWGDDIGQSNISHYTHGMTYHFFKGKVTEEEMVY